MACLTVLVRGIQGRLPVQLSTSGLAYEEAAHVDGALHEVLSQLSRLEADVAALSERLDADEGPP